MKTGIKTAFKWAMRKHLALILIIFTLGVIPRTWATVPVEYKCQILLMSKSALLEETQRLIEGAAQLSDPKEILSRAEKLHEIAQMLFRREQPEDNALIRQLEFHARELAERVKDINSLYPVALSPQPILDLSTVPAEAALDVLSKVEGKVFEIQRLDGKGTLVGYATELTIHVKEPYRAYFSQHFHSRAFFTPSSAFHNEKEELQFIEMIKSLAQDIDPTKIHRGAKDGVFKAWVYNQPTDSQLTEQYNYTQRIKIDPFTAGGNLPFEMAVEADFDSGNSPFGSLIVETIFELSKIELGDLLKQFKR